MDLRSTDVSGIKGATQSRENLVAPLWTSSLLTNGHCKEVGGESNPRRWMKPSPAWNPPRVCLEAPYESQGWKRNSRDSSSKADGLSGNWVHQPSCPSGRMYSTRGFLSPLCAGLSQGGERWAKEPDPVNLLHPGLVWGSLCMTAWAFAFCFLGHGSVFHWEGLMCTDNRSLPLCRGWVISKSHPSKDGWFFSKKAKANSGP